MSKIGKFIRKHPIGISIALLTTVTSALVLNYEIGYVNGSNATFDLAKETLDEESFKKLADAVRIIEL